MNGSTDLKKLNNVGDFRAKEGLVRRNLLMYLAHCVWAYALSCASIAASHATSNPSSSLEAQRSIHQSYARLPLAFERNQGQTDSAVKFLARGLGYNLFLLNQEAVMVFEGSNARLSTASGVSSIRMRFDGAKAMPEVSGDDPLSHKTNYFFGPSAAQHVVNIPSYARVKYSSLYPGVDLVYYGNQGRLEYDLLVAPKTDPGKIRLSFSGVDRISISQAGDLILNIGTGQVTFHKPVAYQPAADKQKPIEADYVLSANGQVGFHLGDYDRSKPLVIDPILSYSSSLWNAGVTGIAVDSSHNAYITGHISSSELPASGGYKTKLTGTRDAYVVKLDPTGTRVVYATYLGGRKAETFGKAIAVDSAGNVYVAGSTTASSFPTTTRAYQRTFSAGASFLTKLNSVGNSLVYSTFVNGAGIAAIELDSSRNVFLTGARSTGTFATTSGAYQTSPAAGVIAKLNATGNAMVYASFFPAAGKDIGIDATGNAYITGEVSGGVIPTQNAFQASPGSGWNAFVTKFNAAGSALVYSTYLGGSLDDYGTGIAVSAGGEAFVVGRTHSNDFPTTFAAFQSAKAHPDPVVTNAFITQLAHTGSSLVYSSYLGGRWCLTAAGGSCFAFDITEIDGAKSVAIDTAGNAYIGGFTTSKEFPLVDPIQPVGNVGEHPRVSFVTKVRPGGDRLAYSVVLGSPANDASVYSLAVDTDGAAYAVGFFGGPPDYFPITGGMPLSPASLTGTYIFKLSTGTYPTTLKSSLNPANNAQSISFTAEVQSPVLGGTVSFRNGASLLGTAPVVGGTAVLTTTLPAGAHKITAVYDADGKVSPPIYQVITTP